MKLFRTWQNAFQGYMGVEIKVAERLRNYSFSGKISYERGVDYITRLMEETNGVVCEVENGVLWLR